MVMIDAKVLALPWTTATDGTSTGLGSKHLVVIFRAHAVLSPKESRPVCRPGMCPHFRACIVNLPVSAPARPAPPLQAVPPAVIPGKLAGLFEMLAVSAALLFWPGDFSVHGSPSGTAWLPGSWRAAALRRGG